MANFSGKANKLYRVITRRDRKIQEQKGRSRKNQYQIERLFSLAFNDNSISYELNVLFYAVDTMKIRRLFPCILALGFCAFERPASADVEAGRRAANHRDFNRAYDEWKPLAEKGNAEAQYDLGRLYANGDGVHRSFTQAYHWFELAAKQGHHEARLAIAKMYQNGDGVEKDQHKSELWRTGKLPVIKKKHTVHQTPQKKTEEKTEKKEAPSELQDIEPAARPTPKPPTDKPSAGRPSAKPTKEEWAVPTATQSLPADLLPEKTPVDSAAELRKSLETTPKRD